MKRNLKIGWISAAAYATTGYGIITSEVVSRLIEEGYEVFSIGGIGGMTVWGGKMQWHSPIRGTAIPILPTFGDYAGSDVAPMYIQRYLLDIVITFWDFFPLDYCNQLPVPWIAYGPIDSPMTPRMANYIRRAFRIVAYSKFGYGELLKFFPPERLGYIPHGIDVDIYRPLDEARKQVREKMYPKPVPEDAFLIIDVAANMGERKMFPTLMLVFKEFLKKHPDAYLYLYTNISFPYPHGYDLLEFANQIGITDHLRYPNFNTILEPLPNQEMAMLYNAADVYCSASIGEGFGMPLLEAQSCGVPCIAPENSSQIELIQGHGWLTKGLDDFIFVPVWIPTLQSYRVPSMSALLEALEEAYNSPSKRLQYAKKSREFSLQYSWDKIMPLWVKLLTEVQDDMAFLKCCSRS